MPGMVPQSGADADTATPGGSTAEGGPAPSTRTTRFFPRGGRQPMLRPLSTPPPPAGRSPLSSPTTVRHTTAGEDSGGGFWGAASPVPSRWVTRAAAGGVGAASDRGSDSVDRSPSSRRLQGVLKSALATKASTQQGAREGPGGSGSSPDAGPSGGAVVSPGLQTPPREARDPSSRRLSSTSSVRGFAGGASTPSSPRLAPASGGAGDAVVSGSGGGVADALGTPQPQAASAASAIVSRLNEWRKAMDPGSGRPYWYNTLLGESTWVEPAHAVAEAPSQPAASPTSGGSVLARIASSILSSPRRGSTTAGGSSEAGGAGTELSSGATAVRSPSPARPTLGDRRGSRGPGAAAPGPQFLEEA